MIEEIGVVKEVIQHKSKQFICIETQIKSTCSSCQAKDNCGTSTIAKAFANKSQALQFECAESVDVGQKVKIGIPETDLLKVSSFVYLLPLVVLVMSALFAQSVLPHIGLAAEGWIILFAFLLTFMCFILVKRYLASDPESRLEPQLISILPPEQTCIHVKQLDVD